MCRGCKIEMPDGPVVYRTEDDKVYVDFMLSERFDIVRWIEIVRRVNDEIAAQDGVEVFEQ